MPIHERLHVTSSELARPALDLATTFVQRWDIYAKQLADGRYICLHEYLNIEYLLAHLRGELTLGTYILNQESQARYVVFDADAQKDFERLRELAYSLAGEGIPSYLEKSRRGGHLWLFFAKPVVGKEARDFGRGLLKANEIDSVEIYPKQTELSGGPGSLIRLPFGIHQATGQRYSFYTFDGHPMAPTIREQIDVLSTRQTVPKAAFRKYLSNAPEEPLKVVYKSFSEATDKISGRIKGSISVLEFVSQFLELKPIASGAVGHCPFHDDQHPSFGVNDKGNYWHCFAGCGGGSIIDFWMKFKGCDFVTAIKELADMLLD